nr:MAG TPA: hypothetical protein [Caudoviricetes sp.]
MNYPSPKGSGFYAPAYKIIISNIDVLMNLHIDDGYDN